MYHLCTTAIFPAIHHKRKTHDIRLNIMGFPSVGVTGFEPATTRPPDVYSKTEYCTYFQRIILLPNVAVDFSVDLTVKG